ncbi:MAG: amino acid adenylation domain-containing protein, partial [bacterium]|nr:amino acid adenylation domain-containing protein [bacterium]
MFDKENYQDTVISKHYKKEKEYWLDRLSGDLSRSSFPYDAITAQPDPDAGDGARVMDDVTFRVPDRCFDNIIKLSNKSLFRMHIIFTSVLVILLNKYTAHEDIIVGAPVVRQEIDANFINSVLILRNPIKREQSFKELLLQVWKTVTGAMEHVNYPMKTLLYQLKLPVENGSFPLFDIAILLDNIHDGTYLSDIGLNMVFNFRKTDEYVQCTVDYNSRLYERATVENIISHFNLVMGQVFADLDMSIGGVDMLTEEEKKQLTHFNSTAAHYPKDKTITQLFEEQARKTPGNIALIDMEQERPGASSSEADGTLTYRRLNGASSGWACLLNEAGVQPGAIVALMMEISLDTVAVILGILKAGAAYVPIDSDSPDTRKKYILEDSRSQILVSNRRLAENLDWTGKIIYIEDIDPANAQTNPPASFNMDVNVGPSDLAYIIYTSGSTGNPKGVMVEHRGLVNYIWWASRQYVRGETANFPFYSSISFDLTVTSIFTPLITGNAIEIYGSTENRELLIDRIIDHNSAGVIKLTPSHLKLIREKKIDATQSNIKRLIVGGEKFELLLARDIYGNFGRKIEIYNEYGPTEAVVGCMIYRFTGSEDGGESVPIGVPISNVQIYILDNHLNPVPFGALGELAIGGDGVARGYLNRPKLTAEKFIINPFRPGQTIYKTGDLAKWLKDGNIEFV